MITAHLPLVFAVDEGEGGGESKGGDSGGDKGGGGGHDSGGDGGGDNSDSGDSSGDSNDGGGDGSGDSKKEEKTETSDKSDNSKSEDTQVDEAKPDNSNEEVSNADTSEDDDNVDSSRIDETNGGKGTPEEQEKAAQEDYIYDEPGIVKPYPPVIKPKPGVGEIVKDTGIKCYQDYGCSPNPPPKGWESCKKNPSQDKCKGGVSDEPTQDEIDKEKAAIEDYIYDEPGKVKPYSTEGVKEPWKIKLIESLNSEAEQKIPQEQSKPALPEMILMKSVMYQTNVVVQVLRLMRMVEDL